VLFFGLWTFGLGLAGPLYSVFMLDRLQISYTEISIFNALFMLTSIAGYRIWAGLIDRFGSKPVLQILMTPAAFLPFLRAFNNPDSYYLVPIALVLGGILFSGIGVGINPLLYRPVAPRPEAHDLSGNLVGFGQPDGRPWSPIGWHPGFPTLLVW